MERLNFDCNAAFSKVCDMVKDGTLERYGSVIRNALTKKPLGHLEEIGQGASETALSTIVNTEPITSVASSLATLGTPVGWSNLAVGAVNLGVTVAGFVVVNQKLNSLSATLQETNRKLDGIDLKLIAIKIGVDRLNENETRKLYEKSKKYVDEMNECIVALRLENFSTMNRETAKILLESASFLESMINRFQDGYEIMVDLGTLVPFSCAYMSLFRAYSSAFYLDKKEVLPLEQYQSAMKALCTKDMVTAVETLCKRSTDSYIPIRDLNLIKSAYKGIIAEQIRGVKSNQEILSIIPHDKYCKLNDTVKNQPNTDENIGFVSYE
jgi:outer membrane murein-binding lipoprotein Lpp